MQLFIRLISSERTVRVAVFLLFGYFFGALLLPAMRGQLLFIDDIPSFFFPFRHWYGYCLQNGLSFLWTPDVFGGMYLHGEGQQGLFHPLHLLLYWMFPSTAAFAIHTAVAYAWLAGGTYALFRHWRISPGSALAGSFLCSFGGYVALRLVHPPALEVWAHAPWNVLFLARLAAADGGAARRRQAGFLGLSTASQCLMGHPPFLYLSFLLEFICGVAFFWESRSWSGTAAAVGGKTLGLLCGLSQLVPTWEVARSSVRAAPSYETLATGSLHPAQFLQWLNPSMAWGDQSRVEYGVFVGAGVLLMAAYYLLSPRGSGALRHMLVWGTALAILLALGRYTWLFDLTSSLYPFKLFRVSARHMALAHLFLVAMGCLGIDLWISTPPEARGNRIVRIVAWLWAAGAVVLFALRATAPGLFGGFLADAFPGVGLMALGMATVVISALAFVVFSYTAMPAWRWGFVGICLLEVGLLNGRAYWRFPRIDLAHYVGAMGELPPVPAPGPVSDRSMTNHLSMVGYRSSVGYMPMKPLMRLEAADFERLLGVRAVRESKEAGWRLTGEGKQPPRAWLVSRVQRSGNLSKDAAVTDFQTVALVEEDITTEPDAKGTAGLAREAPGELEFPVMASGPLLLVVAERFESSWRAFLDGTPVPLLRVNGEVMGIPVPAGPHTVRLLFAPGYLPGFIGLSISGALVCFLLIWNIGFRAKS